MEPQVYTPDTATHHIYAYLRRPEEQEGPPQRNKKTQTDSSDHDSGVESLEHDYENYYYYAYDDEIVRMPMWKSYLYHLQQKAPQPKRLVCQREIPNKPPFYGREYHGAISREDADFLLTIGGEGSYLIRESQRAPGQFTLAIRFETITKNFKLYYDGQHYVGEKRFDTMQDLVADGLITFYLEDKAADYIAALSNQTNYAESPYVAYNTQKRRHMQPSNRKSSRRRERRSKSDAHRDKDREERYRNKTEGQRAEGRHRAGDAVDNDKQQRASPRPSKEGDNSSKSSPPQAHQQRSSPEQQQENSVPAQPKLSDQADGDAEEEDIDHDYINQPSIPDRPKLTQATNNATPTSSPGAGHAPPKPTPRQSRSGRQSEASPPKLLQDEEPLPPPPPSPQTTLLHHSDEPLPPPPITPPLDEPSASTSQQQQQPLIKPNSKSQAKPSPIPVVPAAVAMVTEEAPVEAVARVTSSTNTDGPRHRNASGSSSEPRSPSPRSLLRGSAKRQNLKMFEDHSMLTPPGSPLPHLHMFDPERGGPGGHKPSSVAWCTDYLEVMGCEKPHNFKLHTFKGPHWCDFCANFLWGLIAQGVKCQDCGFNAHKKCSEKVPSDCMPDMKYVKRMFGVDLTTLVKAQNTLIPAVVETCIKEIEKRGLESEGLYRVAGFHDDIEAIKISFDKDGDLTDISEDRYEDLNTITSVLKLYFRLLPIPLITFDIYFKVIDIIKRDELSLESKLNALQHALAQLPPAHYHTLKYLVAHLHRVTEKKQQNKMHAENLATVFSPTLLRSPETDPLTSLTAVKYERELIEILISHHTFIFE